MVREGVMNKEKIENMKAGREMDALVWQALNDHTLNVLTCRHVDGDIQPNAGYPIGHISPPPYSTDISAAWLVVEKMHDSGWASSIENDIHQYNCDFSNVEGIHAMVRMYGYTAMLAICRAAIMAKLHEVQNG